MFFNPNNNIVRGHRGRHCAFGRHLQFSCFRTPAGWLWPACGMGAEGSYGQWVVKNNTCHFQQEHLTFSVRPARALSFPLAQRPVTSKGLSQQGDTSDILRFWGLLQQNIVHSDQDSVLTLSVELTAIWWPRWLTICVNLIGLRDAHITGKALFLGVSVKVFLEETSIESADGVKTSALTNGAEHQPTSWGSE